METKESQLFYTLDESSKLLVKELNISYLEALIHSAENLIDSGKVYDKENNLSEDLITELEEMYGKINLKDYKAETIRKSMQLALIRGMKEDYIQANHQMTPDSLGNLIAYLIEIIVKPDDNIHIADLSVGTANLLLTIHHFLSQETDRKIKLSGVDNDELMISTASTNSAIQKTTINLHYQDALSNLLLEPADVIVSDLPIGYYPLENRANKYKTHFPEDDQISYSHYLLIEQSINYLKESGYA
ncbi:MAG: class I SAM-dependent methyltransferase, partial [Atopostipes sp.]|nr:class I SAM-dependent methyltransferase [Atopostipes sp.]